ncbi:hypothetical protein V3C99_019203 [Haemonchus contortus]
MKRDSCLNLMTFRRTFAWLEDLITGDEKCVPYLNHRRKRQWLRCVEHGIPTSNPEFLPQKAMPSVCSHSTGSFTGTFYHQTPLSALKPSVLCGPDCCSSKRETRESLFSPRQCSPTLFEGDPEEASRPEMACYGPPTVFTRPNSNGLSSAPVAVGPSEN